MTSRKRVVILGATGSIGESALEVIRKHPDQLQLVGVAAHKNTLTLTSIVREFGVKKVAITHPKAYSNAVETTLFPKDVELFGESNGLVELASWNDYDILLVATTGIVSLHATLVAINAGKIIALANKETLIIGGSFIMQKVREKGVKLLPVDSEHSALFQCLEFRDPATVKRLILTASGGPFRTTPLEQLEHVSVEDALKHPTWSMGAKVTIDSATMANKGLEIIEAHWLFGFPEKQIDVVIHPQSLVHSMIEFHDHSILAQVSPTSMTFPIQYALLYPQRPESVLPGIDFTQPQRFDFEAPDLNKFRCLTLARQAIQRGGTAPAVFNAANEEAVAAFLSRQIEFLEIPFLIESVLDTIPQVATPGSIEEIIEIDLQARRKAQEWIGKDN